MKWQENYEVRYHDTNASEVVGISNIFKFLQETAMRQMRDCKPSYQELLNEGKALILSSIRVECYRPIYPYEQITVKSWAGNNNRGFTTQRSYQIFNDEELLCEALSAWALVSTTDKRLLKISEADLSNYEGEEPLTLEGPLRVRIPNEVKMTLVGEYTVRYTDTDINGHMNNTYYPDMIYNCIPKPGSKFVKSLAISYANEAKIGDNLKIYMAFTDGKYYVRSVHEDGRTNIEAELTLEG
ncbi:MAG: hypothetical protein IJ309_03735 [Clostridia bacterium]|nr:hypothetical protein [Clostridia bacterium]